MQWNRRCKVFTVCSSFYFRSCTDTIPLCGVRGVWSEEKHMDHGALRSGPALVRTARLWTDLAAATFSPGSASELGCSGQAGQTARRARTLPHRACTLPQSVWGDALRVPPATPTTHNVVILLAHMSMSSCLTCGLRMPGTASCRLRISSAFESRSACRSSA